MPFCREPHLILRTRDSLFVQVHLEPVVLVPPDEKPHVTFPIEVLVIQFAKNSPRGHHVKQADDDPGVLAAKIPHRVGGIR